MPLLAENGMRGYVFSEIGENCNKCLAVKLWAAFRCPVLLCLTEVYYGVLFRLFLWPCASIRAWRRVLIIVRRDKRGLWGYHLCGELCLTPCIHCAWWRWERFIIPVRNPLNCLFRLPTS